MCYAGSIAQFRQMGKWSAQNPTEQKLPWFSNLDFRQLYRLIKPDPEKKEPKSHPFAARSRHEIWSLDIRYRSNRGEWLSITCHHH
jgi:hypothetical protein